MIQLFLLQKMLGCVKTQLKRAESMSDTVREDQ